MLLNFRKAIPWLILSAAAGLASGGYLLASARLRGPGFPLDDAWIHLTYARNLGLSGEWSFIPGKPSSGSTSPLWTVLLSLSFAARLDRPEVWAYLLGILSLLGLALAGETYFRQGMKDVVLPKGQFAWIPLAGIFLAGEYHLVWASVSGMETVLMAAVYVLGLVWVCGRRPPWAWIGALAGAGVWVRPDGLTLLGPAMFVLLLSGSSWREKVKSALRLAAAFLVFLGPYLWFNWQFQGGLWPNTFFAKQAEYAVLMQRPLITRFLDELVLPLIGAGLLLLPGFLVRLWRAAREREWGLLAAALWFFGYAGLYALRLPVTYQYGRYLIPAMPVFFLIGLQGLGWLWRRMGTSRGGRLARFAYALALIGVWAAFYFLGARNYSRDVAIIQTEMVSTARWVAANTATGDLIAVHDIGAMGYFGGRDVIDLAGLVTPEVIPIIRDEARLAELLDRRGAAYLVTFPGWYRDLTGGLDVVFTSGGEFAPAAGGENMTVYRWRR